MLMSLSQRTHGLVDMYIPDMQKSKAYTNWPCGPFKGFLPGKSQVAITSVYLSPRPGINM